MVRRVATVAKKLCVACGACTQVCPREAVTVWRGSWAQVDTSRCVGCGCCVRTCPAGALSLREAGGANESKALV